MHIKCKSDFCMPINCSIVMCFTDCIFKYSIENLVFLISFKKVSPKQRGAYNVFNCGYNPANVDKGMASVVSYKIKVCSRLRLGK